MDSRIAYADRTYARKLVYNVCCLAGSPSFLDDIRNDLRKRGLLRALRAGDNRAVFDWLVEAVSYQGIADRVAFNYLQRHGAATWQQISQALHDPPCCPKLRSYWQFSACRYNKSRRSCARPAHIDGCPLPRHNLRNGHLNQAAYSLFLFVRDVADGDLLGWIDRQLREAVTENGCDRLARLRNALLDPLRHVYGVSDKVLTIALSPVLLVSAKAHWREVGGSMIAIDTLVHNFLHRSGILARFAAGHAYGPGCYRANGCAAIIEEIAQQIDARQFNRRFPQNFARFVQHAIWRYCAQGGLNICNGNRIDDRQACQNSFCQLFNICDRIALGHRVNKVIDRHAS